MYSRGGAGTISGEKTKYALVKLSTGNFPKNQKIKIKNVESIADSSANKPAYLESIEKTWIFFEYIE